MLNNELTNNIHKIHTTVMGIQRIKGNLHLSKEDIVKWCQGQVMKSSNIVRRGKNWYVYRDNVIITINANTYTIITAHQKRVG